MRLRVRAALLWCSLLALGGGEPAGAIGVDPVLLYDVDFNGFTAGEPVPVDTGPYPRSGPSALPSSLPYVVSSALGLDDQPLYFEWDPDYPFGNEQAVFRMGDTGFGAPVYRVDIDLSITAGDGVATLFLDMPSIFTMVFAEEGRGSGSFRFDYPEGVPFHFTAILDFSEREWQIWMGNTFHSGPLHPSTRISGP